jgi:hypothetical protein
MPHPSKFRHRFPAAAFFPVSGTVAAFCRYQAHQFRFTFNAKRQAFLLD